MRLLLLTALTMIAFAANSVLNRVAVAGGLIDAVPFATVRLLAGAGMLGFLVLARQVLYGQPLWPGGAGRRAIGALTLLVYLFGFSLAYRDLDAGVGALILFGAVQITMFAGALALHEPVPVRRWAGAGLAFGGLVWLFAPGDGAAVSLWHAASMVLAGLGWGLYSLAARGARDPLGATAWNFLLALPIGLAIGVPVSGGAIAAGASVGGIGLAVLSGAVTSGLGYALWYAVLPGLGATRAAVAQLTAPVIAALGGLVFLDEHVTVRLMVAALLVLAGVALSSRPVRG